MSHPPSLFFGVNLWGIAPYSSLSAYFVKFNSIIALYVYYYFLWGGIHIYIIILYSQLLIDVFVFAASSGGVLDWTVKS